MTNVSIEGRFFNFYAIYITKFDCNFVTKYNFGILIKNNGDTDHTLAGRGSDIYCDQYH